MNIAAPCFLNCKWKWKSLSRVWLFATPCQNTGVGSLSLLQGIFPTQGSNPGLLHCRQILYQLSHQGSPRILEWIIVSPTIKFYFKFWICGISSDEVSSVAQLCPTHESQHARPPCPSQTPRVHPNPCPLSWWCHPTISSSVIPFSCPQSFPASGSFQMSQLFASGGQSTGVSASISVLPMNTQDWSPLGWTGQISLQSKGLSRVFSNTTVQKCQFFGAQLSSQSNSHIHTWPLEKS